MQQPDQNFFLTIVDTAGIQDYIFSSNDLKHSLGASYLVDWATHGAVYDALRTAVGPEHCNIDPAGRIDENRCIECAAASGQVVNGELVNVGGGNALLLFRTQAFAKRFAGELTRAVLKRAPGLQVVVAHEPVHWDPDDLAASDALAAKVRAVIRAVNGRKRTRDHWSAPLGGLSVTAACQYTGLPAAFERPKSPDDDKVLQLISAEVNAKEQAANAAKERLAAEVGQDVEFLENFDQLGDKEEFSYLAVVHTDGNGMGKRVRKIAAEHAGPDQNRAYIEAIRAFSASIERAAQKALKAIVDALEQATDRDDKIAGVVKRPDRRLPFRPIVFGGDDLTFVCDGRLGLSITEHYVRAMAQEKLTDGAPIRVRAGIAIVKTHYPFSRAYALAEELAQSAKQFLRSQPKPLADKLNALDWHFASSGVVLDLDSLRQREYVVDHLRRVGEDGAITHGTLLLRPLLVQQPDEGTEWRTWEAFERTVQALRDPNGAWAGKRSKLKALRDALRAGPEAVENYLAVYEAGAELPKIAPDDRSVHTGWYGTERCTCFDAIETYDFYVSLPAITAKEEPHAHDLAQA